MLKSSSEVDTSETVSQWKSIRIDRPFFLPASVKVALQKLNAAGHVAYIVGGCVRDFLLGKDCKDFDIATSALPDEIHHLFPEALTVGKAFGVLKVPVRSIHSESLGDPEQSAGAYTLSMVLEIATFRQDLEYQDGRRPEGVVFSGALVDALRRDFTVNALFFDPKTQRILDATGGLEDLKKGVIKAIGNPSKRFHEDGLRLLRAVRFQTKLGFSLDQETREAIRSRAHLISRVSAERIRDELSLMWMGPRPAEALETLSTLKLLPLILPEVESLKGVAQIPSSFRGVIKDPGSKDDVWTHLLRMLEVLSKNHPLRSLSLSWAAVLHEIGKPVVARLNDGKNFNGHEIEGARLAQLVSRRLKLSNDECEKIAAIIGDQLKFKEVFQMRESTLQRFIRQEHFEDLLVFHEADAITSDGNLAFYEFCSSRFSELQAERRQGELRLIKLIDGNDLIQLGFSPGPLFSEILEIIEDLVLENQLHSKEDALEYVIKNFVK